MLEPSAHTRFGIHYRSKIDYNLEGDADFRTPSAATLTPLVGGAAGMFTDTDIKAGITLPETLSFSGYHEFNDQWAVVADITWTNYSRIDEIRIEFENGLEDGVTTLDWEDTWRYAVGVTYRPIENLVFRFGGAYDESPTPNKQKRSARVADEDRVWGSVGAISPRRMRTSFEGIWSGNSMPPPISALSRSVTFSDGRSRSRRLLRPGHSGNTPG